jgi:hypothetical protein
VYGRCRKYWRKFLLYKILILQLLFVFYLFAEESVTTSAVGKKYNFVQKGMKLKSLDEENQGNRYAIIIGINEYEDAAISKLNKARNDAKALDRLLKAQGQFNKVILLTDDVDLQSKKYPNAENIMGRLKEILSGASENDLILVFFSGHGVTDKDGKGYLVAVDSDQANIFSTGVPVDKIVTELSKFNKSLLLLDACRDVVYKTKALEQNPLQTDRYAKAKLAATFYSTQSGYFSFEDEESDYGVFTRYLLEGLEGKADTNKDSVVSFTEIEQHVQEAVNGWSAKYKKKQKPSTEIHGEKFGDLALTLADGTEKSLIIEKKDATSRARRGMFWRSLLVPGWGQWHGKDYGFDPATQKMKASFFGIGSFLLVANLVHENSLYKEAKDTYKQETILNTATSLSSPFVFTPALYTYTRAEAAGADYQTAANRANFSILALVGFMAMNLLDVSFFGNITTFNPFLKEAPTAFLRGEFKVTTEKLAGQNGQRGEIEILFRF